MAWHQWLYESALLLALVRCWKLRRVLPLWFAFLLCAVLLGLNYSPDSDSWLASWWPWCLLILLALRILSAVEAFVTLAGAWSFGPDILFACWMTCAGLVFSLKAMVSVGDVSLLFEVLAFRRFVCLWLGLWVFLALLIVLGWGWKGRLWAHALPVFALLEIQAAGAVAKLCGVNDWAWGVWNVALYVAGASILAWWAMRVPQRMRGASQYLLVVGGFPGAWRPGGESATERIPSHRL